jgi:hypothetical protein
MWFVFFYPLSRKLGVSDRYQTFSVSASYDLLEPGMFHESTEARVASSRCFWAIAGPCNETSQTIRYSSLGILVKEQFTQPLRLNKQL